MRCLSTEQLMNEAIDLHDIIIAPVRQPLGYTSTFRNKMRHCSVLCLYVSGQREYSVAQTGGRFTLTPGDILYVPQYSGYTFQITGASETGSDYMIAINFSMKDQHGEAVNYGQFPRVLLKDRLSHYFMLFQRIEAVGRSSAGNTMLVRSLVYGLFHELLCELNFSETMRSPFRTILPAVSLIENDPASDDPIPALAELCKLSQTRFRQLFSEYTGGLSPVDYRNKLRIEKADRLIRSESVTVEQAARDSGFRDLSHFYRIYKRLKGHTPVQGNLTQK